MSDRVRIEMDLSQWHQIHSDLSNLYGEDLESTGVGDSILVSRVEPASQVDVERDVQRKKAQLEAEIDEEYCAEYERGLTNIYWGVMGQGD